MKTQTNMTEFVKDLNEQPYVSGEGIKVFDVDSIDKIANLLSEHKNLDDFIADASLKNKMEISRYLNEGIYEELNSEFLNSVNAMVKAGNQWVASFMLRPYVGIDTRGLINVGVGIGFYLDIFAVEESLDNSFRCWASETTTGGMWWKSGKLWKELWKK